MVLWESYGPKSSKKYQYLIINKDIANESDELVKKTLHTETEKQVRIRTFKAIQVDNKNSQSKVKCSYQSHTVYDWFQWKDYLNFLLNASSIIVPYSGFLLIEL